MQEPALFAFGNGPRSLPAAGHGSTGWPRPSSWPNSGTVGSKGAVPEAGSGPLQTEPGQQGQAKTQQLREQAKQRLQKVGT